MQNKRSQNFHRSPDQVTTIDDYFRDFAKFHVQKATELLQPLHVPGRDPLPDFSHMLPRNRPGS